MASAASSRLNRLFVDPGGPKLAGDPTLADIPASGVDVVLEQPKSVSVYYAALRVQQHDSDADELLTAHEAGVDQAMHYLHKEAAWGYLPKSGEYLASTGLRVIQLEHDTAHDSPLDGRRDGTGPPHLHTHLLVVPYVTTTESSPRTVDLDTASLDRAVAGAFGIYSLSTAEEIRRRFPRLRFSAPGPGQRPGVVTVDQELLEAYRGRQCRPARLRQVADPEEPDPLH